MKGITCFPFPPLSYILHPISSKPSPELTVHTPASQLWMHGQVSAVIMVWSAVLCKEQKEETSCTTRGSLKPPTPMGEHFSTNFSSWDLAVPGSPSISKLMSPLRVSPSGSLE